MKKENSVISNIYSYNDYRVFLKDYIEEKKATQKTFSTLSSPPEVLIVPPVKSVNSSTTRLFTINQLFLK